MTRTPGAPDPAGRPRPPAAHVEFRPRASVRRLTGLVLLASVAATVITAYAAWHDPVAPRIGTALVFAVLTGFVWAVRAGTTPARVTLRGGQVEVVRGERREVFDLTSSYTPVEVVGRPGERGWRVVFVRRGMPPFVIDASMVDAREFAAAIEPYLRRRA